jgi:membrane-associated protease RseP (regulator of RpoE activity)
VRLHLVLLLSTALSLAIAGGLFWDPPDIEPDALASVRGWLQVLGAGLPYAFWVLAILGAHEMGHFVACRRYGIPVTLPFFLPGPPPLGTFGAVLRIRGLIPDRRALFDVAAAGPLAGLAVALPVLVVGLVTATPQTAPPEGPGLVLGSPLAWGVLAKLGPQGASPAPNALILAGWVGALFTSLNLFPVGQLDGGHVAFAISRRLHRWLAFGTLAGLVALVLYQALVEHEVPAYGVWILILAWMRDRHPPVVDPFVPLGLGRTLLALLLFVLWLACFIPLPLRVVGG